MDKLQLKKQLTIQLQVIFEAYAEGLDIAPAKRYRTEGFAEALIAAGCLSEEEYSTLIARCYQKVFGNEIPERYTKNNRIPCMMKRAPVYPSTKS